MITHGIQSLGGCDSWRVVVLNWNTAAATLKCIATIDASAAHCKTIHLDRVIVDNGSDPLEKARLQQGLSQYSLWHLTHLPVNLGFAAGMNKGLELPLPKQHQRVLFVNSDVTVDRDFFAALHAHNQNHSQQKVTGVQIRRAKDGSLEAMGGYRYFSWLGAAQKAASPTERVDYVSGAIFLCDSGFLREIGGLPEQNFLYFEELNLAARLRAHEQLGTCATAIARHLGGASTVGLETHPTRHYYAALACFRYTKSTNRIKLPSVILVRLAYLTLLAIQGRSALPAKEGLKALIVFLWESS